MTGRTAPLSAALAALAALAAGAPRATAQTLSYGAKCEGQTISEIIVRPLAPIEHPTGNWWESPAKLANSTHATTRPEVIIALLLLQPGDKCDEFRRTESERVLRAQPFIADAHIEVYVDTAQEVRLVVNTQDEFSFIFAARFSGRSPFVTSLTVGDGDLSGSGTSLAANWTHTADREGFGGAFTSYAFLQRPWQLQLALARGELGVTSILADLSHPFFSDAQRSAWRGSVLDLTLLAPFQRADTTAFDMAEKREFFFAGSATRVGEPGSVALLGLALSSESDVSGIPATGATGYDSTVNYDSLLVRYAARKSMRVNAIMQFRRINYARGLRLGTVNGFQDLRRGVELDLLAGRGFSGLDGSIADVFLNGAFSVGIGGARGYAYLQGIFESRQADGTALWTDAIASARFRWYRRVSDKSTFLIDGEFGGGWNTTRPFELDLGQPDGGVRGYGASHDAGASRVALKLEDRWFLGSLANRVDLAFAAFADAGRIWAGDIPFGTNTPIKIGVGAGVLAAAPVGSRRTYRLDIAFPVSADNYARWEVRVTVVNIAELGTFLEPADVRFGREFVSTSSSFTYPR